MQYELISQPRDDLSPLNQVLINRGIKEEDIEHYLNVSQEDNLNPELLTNLREAAQMLIRHISSPNAHITLIVD